MSVRFADNFNTTTLVGARRFADNFNVFYPTTVVTPPLGVVAVPAAGGAHVTWSAPSGLVDGYQIVASAGGTTRLYTVDRGTTDVWLDGLTNDVEWSLAVSSTLAGAVSDPVTKLVTPTAASPTPPDGAITVSPQESIPDEPTLVSAAARNGGAYLTWTDPAWTGGTPIDHYILTAVGSDSSVVTTTVVSGVTSSSIIGLTNGVTYTVVVTAVNALGASDPSNTLTVTPDPSAPTPEDPAAGLPPPGPVFVPTPAPVWEAFEATDPFAPPYWLGP